MLSVLWHSKHIMASERRVTVPSRHVLPCFLMSSHNRVSISRVESTYQYMAELISQTVPKEGPWNDKCISIRSSKPQDAASPVAKGSALPTSCSATSRRVAQGKLLTLHPYLKRESWSRHPVNPPLHLTVLIARTETLR